MKNRLPKAIVLSFFIFFFAANSALAHQPRILAGDTIQVADPEISKAYYATLGGQEHFYQINSDQPFDLYVNLLLPDIIGPQKEVSAIIKNPDGQIVGILGGSDAPWKIFFEPFGHDSYWQAQEYEVNAQAGKYEIVVLSPQNDAQYVLAIGKKENFNWAETYNALRVIPKIKRDFFHKSPADFILSPFGAGLIAVTFVAAFIFGLLYRLILKKLVKNANRRFHKNIGLTDRLIRLGLAVILFILAITTTWNPLLLFLSGFVLFEAIFSWCGLYAALGKNTGPR